MSPFLRLDLESQCLWRGQERLALTPKAFLVLRHLVLSAGRLVTKSELLQAAWSDTFVGEAVLTVIIKQLRDLLGDDARRPRQIETVHRRGYRLIGDIRCDRGGPPGEDGARAVARHGGDQPGRAPVGRAPALQQLQDCWAAARRGRRQVVFITGEAGIGKTTLVDAFLESLCPVPYRESSSAPISALIGRGHCLDEYGNTEAYLPVLEALEDVLRAPGSDALCEVLRRCAPSWLVQLPWLVRDDDTPRLQNDLPWRTRERMLREIATTIELGSADTPILLVLEDLHWSDPSTVSLLAFLGQRRQPARLLILGTYRPLDLIAEHPLREMRQRLEIGSHCVEVPLSSFTQADVLDFLQTRLGGSADDTLVDLVHRRSNGNPLFVSHLVDHLMVGNRLVRGDKAWELSTQENTRDQVPKRLWEVIEHGLARLDQAEIEVLEAASVCGSELTTAAVASCLDADVAVVEKVCESLARRGDIMRSSGTTLLANGQVCGRYELVHALLQNVLYQRMAPARRMQIHHRLGLWGESNGASPAELAHHFSLAGMVTAARRAIDYAQQAAARARAVFAHEEAVSHWQTALRLVREHGGHDMAEEGEILVSLARAQQRAGHIVAGEANFHAAAHQARARGDAGLLARAAIGIGHGYQRIGQSDPLLIELLEEALDRLGYDDHPLRALALAHLDYALSSVPGSLTRRARLAQEAVAMARRLDDLETLVWVMQYTRWAFRGPQHRDEWRTGIAEIEALLGRVADIEHMLMLRYLLVTDLLEIGDMEEGRRHLDLLGEHADAAQLPWFLWMVLRLRTTLALLCGDLDDVAALATATCEVGQQTDHPNVMQMYAAQMTLLRVEQGRLDEIEPMVRGAVLQHPQVPTWRMFLAYILAELGRGDEARGELERLAGDGFEHVPRDTTWFIFMAFAASTVYALGDRERAQLLYADLLPYQDRCTGAASSLLSFGHMARYLGLLAAAAGRSDEAVAHFTRAIDENERMGAWPWAVLTRLDFARLHLAGGRAAERRTVAALLAPAIEIAQRIGMSGWLGPLQEALAQATPSGKRSGSRATAQKSPASIR